MTRRVGAHLSTSKGIDQALHAAVGMGANALQIFSGSPRMWRRTPLAKINVAAIHKAQTTTDVRPIFTHALYLVNLASADEQIAAHSIDTLIHDLQFDAHIGGAGVVVHLGSHQGRGFEVVKDLVATRMAAILKATPTESRFLIENSAGQQGKLASDLQEIRWLLDQLGDKRVGWCVDTCHAFAAGYALEKVSLDQQKRTIENTLFSESNSFDQVPVLTETIQNLNLWADLAVVHVNDSRDPFDSGRDRHANIGQGTIPQPQLKQFLQSPHLSQVPLITEVPGFAGDGPDAENIRLINDLLK